MPALKVKKLHPDAVLPKFQTGGAAGMDLTAISLAVERTTENSRYPDCKYVYGTGLAFEIPKGYVGLIFPRSSIHKTGMDLTNCVGVIDSDYRGEVKFVFRKRTYEEDSYRVSDRIGQLVIMKLPDIDVVEVTELSETKRGAGGFGSTGR
jgi:dUTP pyrophosphatase